MQAAHLALANQQRHQREEQRRQRRIDHRGGGLEPVRRQIGVAGDPVRRVAERGVDLQQMGVVGQRVDDGRRPQQGIGGEGHRGRPHQHPEERRRVRPGRIVGLPAPQPRPQGSQAQPDPQGDGEQVGNERQMVFLAVHPEQARRQRRAKRQCQQVMAARTGQPPGAEQEDGDGGERESQLDNQAIQPFGIAQQRPEQGAAEDQRVRGLRNKRQCQKHEAPRLDLGPVGFGGVHGRQDERGVIRRLGFPCSADAPAVGCRKNKRSAAALLLVGRPNYLHSAGAKRAGNVPAAAPAQPVRSAPTAAQRHATDCAGGVKDVLVAKGSAVP